MRNDCLGWLPPSEEWRSWLWSPRQWTVHGHITEKWVAGVDLCNRWLPWSVRCRTSTGQLAWQHWSVSGAGQCVAALVEARHWCGAMGCTVDQAGCPLA